MMKFLFLFLSVAVWGSVKDSSTGKGLAGVVVSDGFTCTVTDADGVYHLDADPLARTVSVTVPAGYDIPLSDEGMPAFFRYIDDGRADFTLSPRRNISDRFSVIALADAHLVDEKSLSRFRRESLPDIQKTIRRVSGKYPVVGIGLGDQLSDVMSYSDEAKKCFTSFRSRGGIMPFFYCIGNHDHDNAGGKDEYAVTEHFVRNYGPTDYSFDLGKVHFVVMDDIQYTGTQRDGVKISYTTGFDDRQVEWLRQDLELVGDKHEKAVVLCVHSPMFGRFSRKDDVRELLSAFNEAHILSGHEHNINNIRHGNIWEHNLQSIGGAWWFSNLAPDGSPLGYAVLCFDGASLSTEYNKAVTEKEDFQMRVYSGSDTYDDKTPYALQRGEVPKRDRTYSWPEELEGCFLVRLWDGISPDWEVKFVQNGVEIPMEQTRVKFFDACSCAYMVDVHGAPFGGSVVYRPMLDTFWILKAPCGNPAHEKGWKIVATHKMPSGEVRTYTAKHLMRDYRGFATGTHYVK